MSFDGNFIRFDRFATPVTSRHHDYAETYPLVKKGIRMAERLRKAGEFAIHEGWLWLLLPVGVAGGVLGFFIGKKAAQAGGIVKAAKAVTGIAKKY